MIEQYFPSKREKKVYQQTNYGYQQHNNSVFGEAHKASTRGLSIDEYRERVKIVAQALHKNKWRVGDTGWPCTREAAASNGKMRVVSIVTHFDQYGTVEWNDPPFLLSVIPIDGDTNSVTNCSVGWLIDENPNLVIINEC